MGSKLQTGVKKKAPEEVPFKMRLKVYFGGNRRGGERRKVSQAQVVEPARGAKFEDLKGQCGWREDEVWWWRSVGARWCRTWGQVFSARNTLPHSGLSKNVTSSEMPSLNTLLKAAHLSQPHHLLSIFL